MLYSIQKAKVATQTAFPLRRDERLEVGQARCSRRGRAEPPAAVFIDRDGVINRNRCDYVKSWSEFEFLPGALEALARLTRAGRRVFVVTNQSAVGRGLLLPEELVGLHAQMRSAVAEYGGEIEDVLVCPHRPNDGCACRKPQPGLLRAARDTSLVDLGRSVLIGDHMDDIGAAEAAGCAAVLVLSGRTQAAPAGKARRSVRTADGSSAPSDAVPIVADLSAAVDLILYGEGQRGCA